MSIFDERRKQLGIGSASQTSGGGSIFDKRRAELAAEKENARQSSVNQPNQPDISQLQANADRADINLSPVESAALRSTIKPTVPLYKRALGGLKSFADKSGITKDIGLLAGSANTVLNAPGDAIRTGTNLMKSGTQAYLNSDLSKKISSNLPQVNTNLLLGAKKAADTEIPGVTTGPVANFIRGYADMYDFGTGKALDEAMGHTNYLQGRDTKAAKAGEISAMVMPLAGASAKGLVKLAEKRGLKPFGVSQKAAETAADVKPVQNSAEAFKPAETPVSASQETAATAEAKVQDAHAEADKQNWFTTLFGKRGVGITAGSGGDLKIGTQQQIVDSPIKRDIKGVAQAANEAAKQSYRVTTDALLPIKEHFGEKAYNIAMDSNRADNLASQIIHGEHFVDMQGVRRGKSLSAIMKLVPRGLDNDAIDYLVLRDAKARVGRGEMVYAEKHNMDTVDNIQAKIDQYEKRYKWASKFGKEWDNFNKNIRQYYGLEGDLLNESQIKAMEDARPNYAPQRRQFTLSERIKQQFGKRGMGFSGQKAPIHEVSDVGSRRQIVDPRRTLIEATQQWARNAMMNRVMVHIGDEVANNPESWKGIATIVRDDSHTASKYAKAFADADEMKKAADSGDMENFMETMTNQFKDFMKAKSGDDHVLTYMKKGQPVRIRIENVDAVKALASLSPQQFGPIVRFLSFNSNLIKESASGLLAPMFAAKQFTVDLPQALIQSQRPIQHLGNFVHALASSVAEAVPGLNRTRLANLAKDYADAGGKFSMIKRSEKGLSKSLDGLKRHALLSPQGVAQGVKAVAKSPFTVLHKFGDVFENTNRIAAAKPYLKMERTPENVRNAMNAGREATVNYSRKGSAYKEMEAAIPYTNAAIQSIRKVAMTAKENPVKAAIAMTALVILPKLYEYSQFANDPDYQKIPARNRYRNLIVSKRSDGTFVQIPMPPEYEAVGALMFDMLRRYHDGDQNATAGIKDALFNAYTPPLVTGAAEGYTKGTGPEGSIAGIANSTSLAPLMAAAFNRSFTGAPIVPQRLSGNSPSQQYDEKTSYVARAIGQKIGMSPMKVDYLIRSYGGDLARIVNPVLSPVGSGTPKEVLLKNFIVDPVFTNTLSDDYYTLKGKVTQAESNNSTNGVPFPSWYNKDVADYVTTTRKGSVSKQITELTSQKRDVRANTSLSAAEKSKQLRNIQAQINTLYLDAITKMREAGVP